MKKPYFPLFIDISQKSIVVVGGGRIAERRVKTLLQFAEDIQVISPKLTEELRRLAESRRIEWIQKRYIPGQLAGAFFVLAATDDAACNEQIVTDCRKLGILVNTSHRKELCDFYFPAVVVRKNVVAGITASGDSHAQARDARIQVEKELEE